MGRGGFGFCNVLGMVDRSISSTLDQAMSPTNAKPIQRFLYAACQHGAESVLKQALCEPVGPFRLAYSAKGFLTFKSNMATPIWSRALIEHPLVRSRGTVLERVEGTESGPMVEQILASYVSMDWEVLHVWQRDTAQPGWNGFEPGESLLAQSVAELIRNALRQSNDAREVRASGVSRETPQIPASIATAEACVATHVMSPTEVLSTVPLERQAPQGAKILEVIIDEPNRWWIAAKYAQKSYDFCPGGVPDLFFPEEVISRAYYKIAEAFEWGGIQLRPSEKVVEIGASPGGACQWLLDRGTKVTGIDPAEMDERIANHPNFTHWRNRSREVKRKAFQGFRVLVCDANVTPNYTLDTVEAIVMYPTSQFRLLVLTMKLPDWKHAQKIPEHLERVKSWGFESVEARQLGHNRREYCLLARRRVSQRHST
ncbi:MAG: hypothetical protein FJ308_04490 [Planctomycetes bacterium]|nr:hypothetical protein [Planctomycetota bacterium]